MEIKKDSFELEETINRLLPENEEEFRDDYIDSTALNQVYDDIDIDTHVGTLPITDDIQKQIKFAMESRITNTRDATGARITKIDGYWQQWRREKMDPTAKSKMGSSETFNVIEDWIDDLVDIFKGMENNLKLTDDQDAVSQLMTKQMEISPAESDKRAGFISSLYQKVIGKEEAVSKEKTSYVFKCADVIKGALSRMYRDSDIGKTMERFFRYGLISGEFCQKKCWGPITDRQLTSSTNESDGNKIFLEDQRRLRYYIQVPDTRNLIYDDQNRSWVIEKIPGVFHKLVEATLGDDGKVKDTPMYDYTCIQRVAEYLKKEDLNVLNEQLASQTELYNGEEDLVRVDGNIIIYEGHGIPIVFQVGGKSKAYNCFIHAVNIGSVDAPELYGIRINKGQHIDMTPYEFEPFVESDQHVYGISVPEVIEEYQEVLSGFNSHSVDFLKLALWGVMVLDESAFMEPEKLGDITAKMILKTKANKGKDLSSVLQWIHPPMESLRFAENFYQLFYDRMNKSSRKGSSGEKIQPDPSATEFDEIAKEKAKSENRLAYRLSQLYTRTLTHMYIYYLLHYDTFIDIKASGMRMPNKNTDKFLSDISGDEMFSEKYKHTEKSFQITTQELYIKGLSITVESIDVHNKKAVEKQQTMQIIDLLNKNGFIRNPDGTEHVFQDEAGSTMVISEYKLLKKSLSAFGYEDVLITRNVQDIIPGALAGAGMVASSTPSQPKSAVPPLTARPATSNIQAGVMNR